MLCHLVYPTAKQVLGVTVEDESFGTVVPPSNSSRQCLGLNLAAMKTVNICVLRTVQRTNTNLHEILEVL